MAYVCGIFKFGDMVVELEEIFLIQLNQSLNFVMIKVTEMPIKII